MAIEGIVFDWDGVLVDSQPIFYDVERAMLRDVCARCNVPISEEEVEAAVVGMTGGSALENFQTVLSQMGANVHGEEVVAEYLARMQKVYLQSPLIFGAAETVRRSKSHGRVGLATSTPHVLLDPLLAHHRMTDLFDAVVSAEDVARPKPFGDVYVEAARRMGVPPQHCVAVEDSPTGTRSALAAGMRCIAIPRRGTVMGDFSGAHRVVRKLGDITMGFLQEMDRPRSDEEAGLPVLLYARCRQHPRASVLLFHQLEATASLARDRGWNAQEQFHDVDNGEPWAERPGMRELMRRAEEGHIKKVVVTEPSVLATAGMEQGIIITRLHQHGVAVEAVFRPR